MISPADRVLKSFCPKSAPFKLDIWLTWRQAKCNFEHRLLPVEAAKVDDSKNFWWRDMDFFEPILRALIGGASAAAKGIATDSISSSYDALKSWMTTNDSDLSVEEVEAWIEEGKPIEEIVRRLALEDYDDDEDLSQIVKALLDGIDELKEERPEFSGELTMPLPAVLNEQQAVALVKKYPIGPAVSRLVVSTREISAAFSKSADGTNTTEMTSIVEQANIWRAQADPDLNPEMLVISAAPPPHFISPKSFWTQVTNEAAQRGPRMLVALLLAMPIEAWTSYGAIAYGKLEREHQV